VSWFRLAGRQVPTKAVLSLPLLSWTGERKYDKGLIDQDKGRAGSLTNYRRGQDRLSLGKLVYLLFITNQIRVGY